MNSLSPRSSPDLAMSLPSTRGQIGHEMPLKTLIRFMPKGHCKEKMFPVIPVLQESSH